MAKTILSNDRLQALRDRMNASKAEFVGTLDELRSKLQSMPNVDINAAVWNKDDEAVIPSGDELAARTAFVPVGNSTAPAIMCDNGKLLYLGTLKKKVPEYGDDIRPTGKIMHSNTDLFKAVDALGTYDCIDLIAGKKLKVVGVIPVTTARYDKNRQPFAIRKTNIPEFEIVG